MDTVRQGWTNVRPEEDGQGFTERSAERRQLFQNLKSLHRQTKLPSITWAFLQIADIEVIREVVQSRLAWRCFAEDEHRLATEKKALDTIRLWSQKQPEKTPTAASATPIHSQSKTVSNQPTSTSRLLNTNILAGSKRTRSGNVIGGQEYSVGRHEGVRSNCKKRDGNLCAVTRLAEIDAAHIYPWSGFGGQNEERVVNFWDTLKMFWKEELVESWRSKLFVDANNPNRGTETVENMISLSATLHRFHSAARFALRPIQLSDDKKNLEIEFHWLVVEERSRHEEVDIMDEPLSSAGRRSAGKGYGPLDRIDPDNDTAREPLKSGTKFTMSTDDPVKRPLPDSGLLTLQWHLQRVLAMSGAAEWTEEDFGDDDDDNKNGPGVTTCNNVETWLQNVEPPENHRPSQISRETDSEDSVDGSFE
ncbi:hypothetical protein COCVIDRAFT_86575 [Bipolaris victoriae FI3]|uniref:HNH nuclease domain-containing protein n=1 Tax=Bipolaris victoriae (strain FI3) TaxID=930091 RepID=W7EV72_BIPV3|nr:hypothetical protein COCVIDRAFT_86575 [Bipolaris victoriae FI3]